MPKIFRLILLIVSLIVTNVLLVYHMVSFYKYSKRGSYRYEKLNNRMYMVVKDGSDLYNCTTNRTTYRYGEVDWLIIRSKRHYLFLFFFWAALILAYITSIGGSILEYTCRSNLTCTHKILRILRSILYKSSISIPVMILFAFNYSTACLVLRKTTFMFFSNTFAYVTIVLQLPVLIFVLLDIVCEYYTWKPNATYILLKGSIKDLSLKEKIIRILIYSAVFMIFISGILLSFALYIEVMLHTDITNLVLVSGNILLSVLNILDTT